MIEPIDTIRDEKPLAPEALARIQTPLTALDESKLVSINLNPFMAAALPRAAFPRISEKRGTLEGFASLDISYLDLLGTYALVWHKRLDRGRFRLRQSG